MEVKLKTGQIVLIDDEDFEKLNHGLGWQLNRDGLVYWKFRVEGKTKAKGIHRVVMDAPKGVEVDHINGNRFDNRKCNLRLVNRSQNAMNRGPQSNRQHGYPYKGIRLFKREGLKKCWQAHIKVNGKTISGGYFETALEASKKYDELARIHHGEFAKLNHS